jgi:hypothetical protein
MWRAAHDLARMRKSSNADRGMPAARWSAEEREKRALLELGIAVAVNMRRGTLIARAKERGVFVRVDRATSRGNPFALGRDGDRRPSSPGTATTTCRPTPNWSRGPGSCAGRRWGAGADGVPRGRARGGDERRDLLTLVSAILRWNRMPCCYSGERCRSIPSG